MILDRMRFSVIEANTNTILTRDLVVREPEVRVALSAPSRSIFKVNQGEQYASAQGIDWKNQGHFIVPELDTDLGTFVLGAQIVHDNQIEPATGDMIIEAIGYMGYPKGLPWLENYNPIAVDPAEIIQKIWAHIQSFPNANLGVTVLPSSTGTQMLPGFGFDGSILVFDFFAIFIRAIDFVDCGEQIMSMARDLPLDLFEEVSWNADKTELTKVLRIAYPLGGVQQDNLVFRLGENVINAEKAEEIDVEPVSDVIIRGWLPGRVYSSQLTNADMTRFRQVVMEEDVNLSGTERAAAWALKKLTRRNIPKSFSKITLDPNHPHAPFGSWWVGDSIYIEAPDYPWHGDINEWHRVLAFTVKGDEPLIEVEVKTDGAFNYDPIEYDPEAEEQPTEDENLLSNGYFSQNLGGWYVTKGAWFRVATLGYTGDGCVRVDCDDNGERMRSEKIIVEGDDEYDIEAVVKWQDITVTGDPPWSFSIAVSTYLDGAVVVDDTVIDSIDLDGIGGFTPMSGSFTVPTTGVNEISVTLLVHDDVTGGITWWDDVRVIPVVPA